MNLEKDKFKREKKITSFFFKLGPQILRDTGRICFGYVTWLKYILPVWDASNISYQSEMLQIYPISLGCFKYILPVWDASNISDQSDMLQIYPTTLTWLGYISTQYIHPNISGHNIQGQIFPIQCNNIYPSKGKKKKWPKNLLALIYPYMFQG